MKKICLLIMFLTLLSSIPCFASKIIVNDEKDRIVYSRSSRPDERIDDMVYDSNLNSYERKRDPQLSTYHLTLLSKEFRKELVGKKWNVVKDTKKTTKNYDEKKYNRASREASDYYYVDKDSSSQQLIPSGYAE